MGAASQREAPHLSKSQIRKLGSRLRQEPPAAADIQAYVRWSGARQPALLAVEAQVRNIAQQVCGAHRFETSIRIKQIASIRAKLLRLRTSLASLEDIAGCRIVVPTIAEQEAVITACERFEVTRRRDSAKNRKTAIARCTS